MGMRTFPLLLSVIKLGADFLEDLTAESLRQKARNPEERLIVLRPGGRALSGFKSYDNFSSRMPVFKITESFDYFA